MSSAIIVALDFSTKQQALTLAKQLDPARCRVKIASTLFTHYGPALVEELQALGFDVFLDLKYHDIPNQVAAACLQAAKLGVWMLTVHCSGGEAMLMGAREALEGVQGRKPLLVGVTILTSLSDSDLSTIGYTKNVMDSVCNLAQLAKQAGLDGVVSSATEVASLKKQLGDEFVLVTPGIRLTKDGADDQKRIMTPRKAIAAGATYLVVGRAITQAPEPMYALQKIWDETRNL